MPDPDTVTFAYASSTSERSFRFGLALICLAAAIYYLMRGDAPSLFEQMDGMLSDSQNHAVNVFVGFVLGTLGFVSLLNALRNSTGQTRAVEVTKEVVRAPDQGRSGRSVQIALDQITKLEKLSIDGVWEVNIASRDARIRIAKSSLAQASDFDRMIHRIDARAPNCQLQITQRIDPPEIAP